MSESEPPVVTVIMPVRNEASFIARSLRSVLAQEYPLEQLEVIVADGRSTDGTRQIVERMAATHPQIRLLDNPGRIVATGLNLAVRQSRGEIVVRVDGHCEIAPDFVSRCVEHLSNDGADGVGGPVETVGETRLAQAIAVAMSSSFGVGDSAFRTVRDETILVDTVPFPAYKRCVIDQLGPFDEELVRNQDDEYNYRLRKAGGRVLLAADVHSRYRSRSSLWSLWRQYFQYGYWKVRVMQKHPRQMRPRQFVPPLFVATLLISLSLVPFTVWAERILGAVAGSYGVAMVIASVGAAREGNWRVFPLIPAAFATLHAAYGVGFLVGLVRFSTRWVGSGAQWARKARGTRPGPGSGDPNGSPVALDDRLTERR